MNEPQPLNVFVATPGDCADERAIVRRSVAEWNTRRGASGVQFDVVGWEQVRGTARRPQEAINELIGESHFFVAIFKGRWGSEPGSSWGYTSGTEEELFGGLVELGHADQPMRDVWVAFIDTPGADQRIIRLKQQLIDRHAMLFESISDALDLKAKFSARLDGWCEAAASPKVPRHVELVSSTGSELLRATRLRVDGEKLIELGHGAAGIASLEEASAIGGPLEDLAYARHLARQGDLDRSQAATEAAIAKARESDGGLFSTMAAEAFAAQAGILRRRGEYLDAVGRLEQALTLVRSEDEYARRVRCRILDEIGLARKSAKDLPGARAALQEALALRRTTDAPTDTCQSLINLARLAVDERDLTTARQYSDECLTLLQSAPPSALHANAQTLAAQVRLRQGLGVEGIEYAERAVALNRQFESANGEAIALLVLTQCYRATGQNDHATVSGQACIKINNRIGNAEGASQAQWQLDAIASA